MASMLSGEKKCVFEEEKNWLYLIKKKSLLYNWKEMTKLEIYQMYNKRQFVIIAP
jgi:hypothetical protein